MADQESIRGTSELFKDDRFEVGGEDLLAASSVVCSGSRTPGQNAVNEQREKAIADIQIRIGTLLKTDNVSFLLGAGASVGSGGLTVGEVPLPVESALLEEGISSEDPFAVCPWLEGFYFAAKWAGGGDKVPITTDAIMCRREQLEDQNPRDSQLQVNLEAVLSVLHCWRSALSGKAKRLRLDGEPKVEVEASNLDECIEHVTRSLAERCVLPTDEKSSGLLTYKTLVRKTLTRPLNLKRVNFFTLNYDTLVEQAADAEGVVPLDGFVGTIRRIFRPESYEQDLYFPAETTEGRVHRFDRVLHLYKLHGSITWVEEEATLDNPYGVAAEPFNPKDGGRILVYPAPTKAVEALGMPYAELFRRFAAAIARPQSVLFVIGYGFGDEHVNAIIRQALAVPSFTLVVVDPKPSSDFVQTLRDNTDRRVWTASGPRIGEFSWFVDNLLPDLRDEEIRAKVTETHKALRPKPD